MRSVKSPSVTNVSAAPKAVPNSAGFKRKIASMTGNPFMHVDKKIVDELLLVCGVIGSTDDQGVDKKQSDGTHFVPVEDCLNWLQDLQRVLRRDDDTHRPISLLLGQWKIVSQKLLALVMNCRYDTPLVLTIVKILVILTKPMTNNAKKAARYAINAKKFKHDKEVIQQQLNLRDNGIAQATLLTEYKRAFVYHPSHRHHNGSEEKGLISIFVSLLAEPLSRSGTGRTDSDHLTIELVLHLIRNLLSAGGEPFMEDGKGSDKVRDNAVLHQDLLSLFQQEMVLDVLLILGQDIEKRENKQYNLLLMEILHHMLKNQDPTLVSRSAFLKDKTQPSVHTKKSSFITSSGKLSLSSQLQKERTSLYSASSSRHSHFGGTLVLQKTDGQQRLINATTTQAMASRTASQNTADFFQMKNQTSNVNEKRKSKKHQYFVGSDKLALYSYPGSANSAATNDIATPSSQRSQQTLHSFCAKFVPECYGPLMKTLKEEFRRDSNRLEEEDKVIFYRIVWFFSQWWRISRQQRTTKPSIGPLIFTMDVFTYNLVLSSAEFYFTHKLHSEMAQTVSLYTEMTHLLFMMYESKDQTEHIMSLGLMDRLFYQSEPSDHLPKLLKRWTPSKYSREYLCDLIELIDVTLKLLEQNAKSCKGFQDTPNKKIRRMEREENEAPKDIVSTMKEKASEFDITTYLARKIFSNQVVLMFTQLLSKYSTNAPHINDHIIALFVRFCNFVVVKDDDYSISSSTNQLTSKPVTLEPMLFNIPMLTVANCILNDLSYRSNEKSLRVLSFVSTYMRHYARECQCNTMMHVETLFRHPLPYRFCELSANLYITEELRMIAERNELVEAEKTREIGICAESDNKIDVLSDEEEMEFDDTSFTGNRNGHKDNRWSDRQSHIPKRKVSALSKQDQPETTPETTPEITPKKRRVQQHIANKSSSDNIFNEINPGIDRVDLSTKYEGGNNVQKKRLRKCTQDSDSDDGFDASGIQAKNPTLFLHDDDDDSE